DVHSALDWIDRHDEEIQRRFAALSSERPKTLKKYEKIPSSTIMTALRKAGKIDPDVTDEKFFQDWIRAAGARDLAKRVAPILEAISERFTNPLQAARWSFEHLDEIRQLNWEGLGKEKGTLSLETVLDALWVAQKLPEGTTREEMKSWGRLAGAFDLAIRISPIFKKIEQPFRNARSAIEWIRDHHDEIVQENIRALARRGNGYLAYGTILAALWADGKLHPAVDVHKLKGWMQQAAAAEYARAEQEMIQETIREAWSQTPPSERQKLHDRHRLYAALWNSASHRFLRRDVPTQRISQGYFEKVMPFAMRWYGERFLSELGSGTSAQEGGAKAFRAYLEEHQYPGGPIQMIVDAYKGGKQVVVLSDPHPDTSGTTYSQFLEALVVRLSREVGLKKLLIEYHPRAVEEELLPLIREDKETWERFWNFVRAEDPDEPSQELFKQHFPSHWLPMLRAADARGVEIFGFNPRGHLGFSGWLREEGLPEEGGKTEERFTEEILNRLDLTDSTERVLVISGLHHVAKTEALKRMGNLLTRNSGLKVTTVLVHIGWRRVGLKRRFLPGDYLLPLLRRAKIPVVAVHHTALSPIGNLQVFKEWIISTLLDAPVEGTPRDRIVARLKDFDMLVYFDSQDAITQYVETAAKDGGAARDGGEKVDYRPQTSDKRHQERELEERGISRTENISEPSSDAGIDPLRQEPVLEELLHRRYRVPSSYSPSFSGQNHNPSPNATKATHTKASLEPPDNLKNRSPANAAAASILNRSINVFERSPRLPSESDGFAISNTSIPNPDESVKVYKLSVSDDSGAAQDGGEQYSQELLASLQQIVGATPQKPFALPKELVGYASRLHAFASDMPLDEQWSLVEKFFTTLFRAIRSEDALRQQTAITIWKLLEPHFSSQAQVAAKGYAEEVGVWKEAIDAIVGPEEGAVQRRVAALSEEIRERMRHRWDKGNHNEVVGQEEEKLREIVVLKRKGWAPHASIKLSLANVFSEVATGLFGSIPPERRGPKINLTEEEFSTLLRAKAYYHMAWEWRPGWWGGSLTGDSDFRLSKINDILNKAPKDQLEAVRSRLKQEGFTDEELGTARDGGNHTSTELVRWLNGHPREIEKRLIEMMDEPEVQRMLQMLQSLGLSPEHPLQFRYTDAESLDYAGMILLEEDPVGLPIGLPSTWFRRPYHESLRILKHELTHIILFRNKMVDPQRTLQLFQYIKTIDPTSKQKAAHDLLDDLLDYEVVRFQLENNFPNAANALLNDIFPGGEEEKKKRETIRDYHKTHPMPAVDQFRKATLFYTSWYVEGILPFEHLQQPGHEGLRRRFETRFRDVLTEGDLTTIHTIIQEILVPALLDHTWPQKFQEIFEDFYHRVYTYFPSFKPPTPMQDGSDGAAQDGSTKKEREKEEKREAFVIKESEKLLATPLPEDETALFRLRETLSAVERSISGSFGRQFIERWDDPKPIQTSPEREIVETYGEQLQARIQEIDQKLKLEHLTPMGFVDETFAREAVRSYEEFLKASLPQDPHVLQALLVLLITTIAELNQTVGDIIRSGRHTSDNAQIKAKLAALSGGADFKGISQRLNEKLTLVLKTLDHKKSARDG
ncbi:MAG: hypothetical protein HY590_03745, partial [Candidatus Omnitrophica bacterium]|nr:hypothetical protein [Candidatus Omnitrophota bacterium]